jgi:hypothetical protein
MVWEHSDDKSRLNSGNAIFINRINFFLFYNFKPKSKISNIEVKFKKNLFRKYMWYVCLQYLKSYTLLMLLGNSVLDLFQAKIVSSWFKKKSNCSM